MGIEGSRGYGDGVRDGVMVKGVCCWGWLVI